MMKIECLKNREMDVAVVSSDEKVIVDVQSALDLVISEGLECPQLVIRREPGGAEAAQ